MVFIIAKAIRKVLHNVFIAYKSTRVSKLRNLRYFKPVLSSMIKYFHDSIEFQLLNDVN